jgi:hypothetical protein
MKNWLIISGKVIYTNIEREVWEHEESWNVIVGFEYSVGGRSYTSSQGLKYPIHYLAWGKKREYPDGGSVTVFYNPKRPDAAVLEKPKPKPKWFFYHPIIDLTLGILGILVVIAAIFNFLYY